MTAKTRLLKEIRRVFLTFSLVLSISVSLLSMGYSYAYDASYDVSSGSLNETFYSDSAIEITGTSTTNTVHITVESGKTVTIDLNGVNIDVSSTYGACAFMISGDGNVSVNLVGTNNLASGVERAALQKENTGTLTISGDGALSANGGIYGAGIGGGLDGDASNIVIAGGTINATGGDDAAGIGGGRSGDGSDITISCGMVTVTGGEHSGYSTGGAGIGGGYTGDGSHIVITGGSVTANGGYTSAGIGGGKEGNASYIEISGGTVIANGGTGGAGIGSGFHGDCSNISISGGTVSANGGHTSAGIGAASEGDCLNITISGGTVAASGGENGAGIGGGINSDITSIVISDGTVTATGGDHGPGIGAVSGNTSVVNISDIGISGGTVTAVGGQCAAGIGTGPTGNRVSTISGITISGSAVVSASGGAEYSNSQGVGYGAGPAIGMGGHSDLSSGDEVVPDTSGLYPTGTIYYYVAGTTAAAIDNGTAVPAQTTTGSYDPTAQSQSGQGQTTQGQTTQGQTTESQTTQDQTTQAQTIITEISSNDGEDEKPSRTYLDDLSDKISENVALGGPQMIEWNEGNCLSYGIMRLLEENPQITLVYSYSYDGVDYKVTIPGKYVKTDTAIPWYGPLYLWANFGMYGENETTTETSSQIDPVITAQNDPTATTAAYTVVAGDTLSRIAIRLHTTVDYLAYVNGIKNPNKIRIGQIIKY